MDDYEKLQKLFEFMDEKMQQIEQARINSELNDMLLDNDILIGD